MELKVVFKKVTLDFSSG